MLHVFLECPFLIALSVFSNICPFLIAPSGFSNICPFLIAPPGFSKICLGRHMAYFKAFL